MGSRLQIFKILALGTVILFLFSSVTFAEQNQNIDYANLEQTCKNQYLIMNSGNLLICVKRYDNNFETYKNQADSLILQFRKIENNNFKTPNTVNQKSAFTDLSSDYAQTITDLSQIRQNMSSLYQQTLDSEKTCNKICNRMRASKSIFTSDCEDVFENYISLNNKLNSFLNYIDTKEIQLGGSKKVLDSSANALASNSSLNNDSATTQPAQAADFTADPKITNPDDPYALIASPDTSTTDTLGSVLKQREANGDLELATETARRAVAKTFTFDDSPHLWLGSSFFVQTADGNVYGVSANHVLTGTTAQYESVGRTVTDNHDMESNDKTNFTLGIGDFSDQQILNPTSTAYSAEGLYSLLPKDYLTNYKGNQDVTIFPVNALQTENSTSPLPDSQFFGSPSANPIPIRDLTTYPVQPGEAVYSCGYPATKGSAIYCEQQTVMGYDVSSITGHIFDNSGQQWPLSSGGNDQEVILTKKNDSENLGGISGGVVMSKCPDNPAQFCALGTNSINYITGPKDKNGEGPTQYAGFAPIYQAQNPNTNSYTVQATDPTAAPFLVRDNCVKLIVGTTNYQSIGRCVIGYNKPIYY